MNKELFTKKSVVLLGTTSQKVAVARGSARRGAERARSEGVGQFSVLEVQ